MRLTQAVTAAALLWGALSAQSVTIDFDELAPLTNVTSQYYGDGVVFSSVPGFANRTWDVFDTGTSPPNFIATAQTGGGFFCNQPTYLDFYHAAENVKFYAVADVCSGTSAVARVKHAGGTDDVDVVTDGDPSTPELVDLSGFKLVSRVELIDFTESCGLGWDDFSFEMVPIPVIEAMSDCGGNLGTLTPVTGVPALGEIFTLDMDKGQVSGAQAFLPLSLAPDPAWPDCGTAVPGGELLISVLAPNPVFIAGGCAWTGTPLCFTFMIPDDPTLIGVDVYMQGLFLDAEGAAPGSPFRLTNGLILKIG